MDNLVEVDNPRFASAVFCDDIRYEVGNKVTLVGLYNRDLFVPEFPTNLSRLAVSLTLDSPIDEPIESLTVLVEKADEKVFDTTLQSLEAYSNSMSEADNVRDKPSRVNFGMHFFLPPMPITEPCAIRVKVIIGNQVITAGKIFISAISVDGKNAN